MLNDIYFELGFIMFLNYNRIELIRVIVMNFREVNKKLNDLKQSDNKQALEQFRNTRISELHYLFK